MSAPLLLVPLVTALASLLLMSQPAQTLSIKQIFESKSTYFVFGCESSPISRNVR